MTLAATTRRADGTGNGTASTFSFNFKVFDDDDIEVVVVRASTRAETTLVKNTDYTVSFTSSAMPSTGTITLVDADQAWLDSNGKLATGYSIAILGAAEYKQDTRVSDQGTAWRSAVERQLDKTTILLQQVKERLGRALTLQKGSTESGIEFRGVVSDSDGQLLRVDTTGTYIEPSGVTASDLASYASSAQSASSAAASSASAAASSASTASASSTAAAASATSAASSATAAAASAATAAASGGYNTNDSKASPQAVTAGGTITYTAGFRSSKCYVNGSPGAVSVGNIQAGTTDGDALLLVGGANSITFDTTGNISMRGALVLGDGEQLMLNWDHGSSLWREV